MRARSPSLRAGQWKNEHLKYCVELARQCVSDRNFKVFEMLMFGERTVVEVCEQLGLNANQIYKAKAQVLQCVRDKLQELGAGVHT